MRKNATRFRGEKRVALEGVPHESVTHGSVTHGGHVSDVMLYAVIENAAMCV